MSENYETVFVCYISKEEIANIKSKDVVNITFKKKIKKHGQFQYFVQRYHSHQIQKYFGISLIEFLAMPLDKIDDLFELSLSWLEEEITQVEELQDGLEDATKRGDKQMKGFSF